MNQYCWKCHELLTDHFQMNSIEMMATNPPMPGDLSMCGACGAFSVFNGLLQLEKPDKIMMRRIENTPALMDMQARLVKRDGT